jgi:short-subunit dehydrogenase
VTWSTADIGDLTGRLAVVTGATSGLGLVTARELAAHGAHVVAAVRDLDRGRAVFGDTASVAVRRLDLASQASVADFAAGLADEVGAVDVLVNNAGIGWLGKVEDMPPEQVRKLFDINVLGLIDLTQRVLPGMLERGRGHVINVASVASWIAVPPLTVYSATKFAVQGFSEGLRREVAGRGVAVTTVNPGPVATRFGHRARFEDPLTERMGDGLMPGVPVSLAARAVVRAIRMGGAPGYASISVPRVVGLARLAALPGARLVVDAGAALTRGARVAALTGEPPGAGGEPDAAPGR